ncbi:MAG: DUF2190 family protein [Rhodobacteraceae bacterium]|nr:DUF2190 family protein [Paracoccaceae bacterium]
MKNFIQKGDSITVTAPADVSSGDGVLVDALFGVASGDALTGADVVLATTGVFDLPKVTADDLTFGKRAYWNAGTGEVTATVSSNKLIGVAVVAAGAGAATVAVRLNGSF